MAAFSDDTSTGFSAVTRSGPTVRGCPPPLPTKSSWLGCRNIERVLNVLGMFLISSLFTVATRSTIATAFPLNSPHTVADIWTTSSFTGGGGAVEETLTTFYGRAEMTNPKDLRTISNIVWSCLATMFACSWVSVHPNVPSPNDSEFSVLRRRIGLMFWAIVAPELLIIWAMRQWLHANRIARKYRSQGWTTAHGHFLVMGGFMLYDQAGKATQTLSIERFTELLKDKSVDFPLITKKEILDRSKGDFLSKTIIMIQVAWFAVQCMARRSQGLAITELELVTLAFTTLNGAMYFFWWDKPLDVQSTFRIPLKKPLTVVHKTPTVQDEPKHQEIDIAQNLQNELDDGPSQDETPATVTEHKYEPLDVEDAPLMDSDGDQDSFPWKTRARNYIIGTLHSISHAILQPFKETARYVKKRGVIESIFRVSVYLPVKNTLFGFSRMVENDSSSTVAPGTLRVPTFYAPTLLFSGIDTTRIVASGLGIIFGSIHLAAWSGEFPTHAAQILWRVASLAVTLIPAVIFVSKLISRYLSQMGDKWESCLDEPLFMIEFMVGSGGILLYVPSRIALLFIAFYSLKSIPPSGFQNVVWTSFIPHIS